MYNPILLASLCLASVTFAKVPPYQAAVPTSCAEPNTTTSTWTSVSQGYAAPTSSKLPTCGLGTINNKQFLPDIGIVYQYQPTSSDTIKSPFYVYQEFNRSHSRGVLMYFEGVPSQAKNCYLRWFQPLMGTNFGYFSSGLTTVLQYYPVGGDWRKSGMAWEDLQGLQSTKVGGADFTYWPESLVAVEHDVGPVNCQTEVSLGIWMAGIQEGSVVMEQTDSAGFYLTYDC